MTPPADRGQAGRELLRLFVAVELDEEALRALASLQDALRRRGLDALRWVRPEGVHLTLKFLGETPPERVPAIEAALNEAVSGVPAHALRLDGLGTFGSRRSPRVLWVGLDGDLQELRRLQQRVEAALAKAGFPKEARAFSPHLTLARVRPETAAVLSEPIARALEAAPQPEASIAVREVSLMRSILGPGGAVYHRLAAFPLAVK